MLRLHTVKHVTHIVAQSLRSVGARCILETDFFHVGVKSAFVLWDFAERLDFLHKHRMHFGCDRLLFGEALYVAAENVHQRGLGFVVKGVGCCNLIGLDLSCADVDGFASKNPAVSARGQLEVAFDAGFLHDFVKRKPEKRLEGDYVMRDFKLQAVLAAIAKASFR